MSTFVLMILGNMSTIVRMGLCTNVLMMCLAKGIAG